ncbi:MAG: TonB-dependent receptor [Kofleriaceae bacterium]
MLLLPASALADPITATVIDGVTMVPIAGATVTTGAHSARSGLDGAFTIDPAGALTVTAPGYEPSTEVVAAGGSVVLFREGALAEVITIENRAPRTGATLIARDEIRNQPGGGADGLAAVRSLPGVGTPPPTAGGRLVIRGASPEDSLLTIDGIPVPFVYHSFNNTTVLPVGMIGAIAYAPGGFGAEEGRATGGVVAITTDDTPITEPGGEVSASFTEASGEIRIPLASHLGLRAGARRSTVDLLAPVAVPDDLMIGFTTPPRFYDAHVQLDWRPTGRDRVALLALTSYDRLGIVNRDPISDLPAEFSATGRFGRAILSWKHAGEHLDNRLVGALGIDSWDSELDAGQELHSRHGLAMLRDDATLPLGDHVTVRAGGLAALESNAVQSRLFVLPSEGLPPGRLDDLPIRELDTAYDANIAAAYAAVDVAATAHTTITSGVRVEHYGHIHETRVLPRLQLAWTRGPVTLRGALGLYARDLDQLEGVPTALRPETATQVTSTAEVTLAEGLVVATSGFATVRRDLVIEDMASTEALPYRSGAHGRGGGAEFLLRFRRGDTFAWLAYTYSRSTRDDGDFTMTRATASDQPHVLTALVSTKRGPWRFGARWQLASGLPYTDIVGATYIPEADRSIPTLGDPFAARYPTSHQLDLRVERTWQRKHWRLVGFIDVANTYRNGRVIRYQYDPTYASRKPIEDMIPLPSVGLRAER